MTPEAIARRIGMLPAMERAFPCAWLDRLDEADGDGYLVCLDGNLRATLMAGDRPVRIMASLAISVEIDRGRGLWTAWTYTVTGDYRQSPKMAHPADAILAAAEALPGEQT
jgi:hypothetical protein